MEKIVEILTSLPLFKGIDGIKLSAYLSSIDYHEKKYQKDTALILQGMPYKALYIIASGECVGQMSDPSGKIITIEDFKAPYALASALLFAADNRIPVTVFTKTDVDLVIIKRDDLVGLCQKEKRFLLNLFGDVADKFTFLSNKLMYLQFKSLPEKILFYLSKQSIDDAGWMVLRHSIQELSTLFGVERPSLSRALIRMEDEGIIERDGKRIRLKKG
jgi:CRP-like cAMP-binding protein